MDLNNNSKEILEPVSVSVIIPFYGNKKDLSFCLQGIYKQKFNKPFEIILVESLKDPEIKQIADSFPNLILISSDSLMFPGKARNLGVKNSKSNLFAFIDADCIPSRDWLSQIYSSLNHGNEIVIGPIINLYPFHPIASVDNLLQFPDFQKYSSDKKITHFPACNLGLTKKLFLQTEGFPENIVTGEDVIFSQTAINKNGGMVFYNVRQIVKHSGRKDLYSFIVHNKSLGFYRGYLSLKIPDKKSKFRGTFLFAFIFGVRRLIYILIRTIQWNPISLLRIIFFSPFLLLGLSAWTEGFWNGNKKYMRKKV